MANRDIVAIGASAGGFEPLRQIVGSFPADLAAAVFVVLHIGSGHSILAELLNDSGKLPARFAESGVRIRHGHVYVAPPDMHMTVADGHLAVSKGPRENSARPAIDPLFRSLAQAFGPRVIGVILSGALNDGTAGLLAVKRGGGIAVVQDPDDALFRSMPESAAQAVAVDHAAPARELGPLVTSLVAQTAGPGAPVPAKGETGAEPAGPSLAHATPPGGSAILTCPDCGGRLSMNSDPNVLRFTCTVGHVHTAETFLDAQATEIERALWLAVRANEERAALLRKMRDDARREKRHAVARLWDERAAEYAHHARTIRALITRGGPVPALESGAETA